MGRQAAWGALGAPTSPLDFWPELLPSRDLPPTPLGDVFAAWVRSDGTDTIIQGSEKPLGADWQMPMDLSEAGQNSSEPLIAVDGPGDTVAIWQRYNGTDDIIQSSTRPAGGAWHAPIDLSEGGQDASEPHLALDGSGNALAVWSRSNGTNTIIQAAARDCRRRLGAGRSACRKSAEMHPGRKSPPTRPGMGR